MLYAMIILLPQLCVLIARVIRIILFQGNSYETYILPVIVEYLLYTFSIEANQTQS